METINVLPGTIHSDIKEFVGILENEPFDAVLLQNYGLENGELIERLGRIYMI